MANLEVYNLDMNDLKGALEVVTKLLEDERLIDYDLEALLLLQDDPSKLFEELEKMPEYREWVDFHREKVRRQ